MLSATTPERSVILAVSVEISPVTVVAKFSSSPNAVLSSPRVLSNSGAPPTIFVTVVFNALKPAVLAATAAPSV